MRRRRGEFLHGSNSFKRRQSLYKIDMISTFVSKNVQARIMQKKGKLSEYNNDIENSRHKLKIIFR